MSDQEQQQILQMITNSWVAQAVYMAPETEVSGVEGVRR